MSKVLRKIITNFLILVFLGLLIFEIILSFNHPDDPIEISPPEISLNALDQAIIQESPYYDQLQFITNFTNSLLVNFAFEESFEDQILDIYFEFVGQEIYVKVQSANDEYFYSYKLI